MLVFEFEFINQVESFSISYQVWFKFISDCLHDTYLTTGATNLLKAVKENIVLNYFNKFIYFIILIKRRM